MIDVYFTPENDEFGEVTGWIAFLLDITDRKQAEETEKVLVRELQHRSNNLLAVVQAIAHRSLALTSSLTEESVALDARLHALADANRLLAQQ